MAQATNFTKRATRRIRRQANRLAADFERLGPIYNVCAYRRKDRLLKETLTAATHDEATDLGREVLRRRGFALKGIRLVAVRVSPRAVAEAVAADARFRSH